MNDNKNILNLPSLEYFGDWETLQKFLERRGNPFYSIEGDLNLMSVNVETLGNLVSVGGNLDLRQTKIKTLGSLTSVDGTLYLWKSSLTSLGNLTSVGCALDLYECRKLSSLGKLVSVGSALDMRHTKIKSIGYVKHIGGSLYFNNHFNQDDYPKEEVRQKIKIGGGIYYPDI